MPLLICLICSLNVPNELKLLLEETEQKDPNIQVALTLESEKLGALQTAESDFLPTARLSAESGPTRTYEWRIGKPLQRSQEWTWNHQLSATANWNLINGGLSQNKKSLTYGEIALAQLESQKVRAELYRRSLGRIVALTSLSKKVELRKTQLAQAQELKDISERKTKSGFFGRRELIETRRETARAEFEWFSTKKELEKQLGEFNLESRLTQSPLTEKSLASIAVPLANALNKVTDDFVAQPNNQSLKEKIASSSIALNISSVQQANAQLETSSARVRRWSPTLDLSVGAQYTFLDRKAAESSVSAAAVSQVPDRRFTPYAALNFSMNLFDPVISSRQEESELRERTQKIQRDKILKDTAVGIDKIPIQIQISKESEKIQSQLIAISEELLGINKRLFEAGELDARSVILSSQEVSFQKEKFLENDQKISEIGLSLWKISQLGLSP